MRALNERAPLTTRTNTLRLTREALAARLRAEEGLAPVPTVLAPEGLTVDRGGAPDHWRAFADGSLVVQDEGSMLVARLLEPQPGQTVGDACAAPGTKTTHLAQLMENQGRVIAFDPQPARLARIGAAASRLGVDIVDTHDGRAQDLAPGLAGVCDAVLVDAPCSNLGVLRRNPEVKWRRGPEDVKAAATQQGEILWAAATMVKPGGRLVYATCSLEPEENEEVVAGVPRRPYRVPPRPARCVRHRPRRRRLRPLPAASPRHGRLHRGPAGPR